MKRFLCKYIYVEKYIKLIYNFMTMNARLTSKNDFIYVSRPAILITPSDDLILTKV